MSKKKITVYHSCYLHRSETFIYRQLCGLSEYCDLEVITNEVLNRKEFPLINPAIIPRFNYLEKLLGKKALFFKEHLQKRDLFHVNFGNIALGMRKYAQQAGIPMTTYFLGYDASKRLKNIKFQKKLKKSSFDAIFVNSYDMKNRLSPYLPQNSKCYVAYLGIPLKRFPFSHRHSVPEGATFLQVSRLHDKKGIDITLRAFARYFKECDSKSKLIIAGDGPLKSELQQLAHKLGIGNNSFFAGSVGYAEYIKLLQSSDVFVHPSVTASNGDMEGLPTAICEAMACGLPVLSTWHSGIPEIINNGEDGFLAKEKDEDELFQLMKSLRKADIGEISVKARKKIESKFDHNKTIRILFNYMENVIRGRDI